MLILDTDHLTIIQRATEPAYTVLHNRLQQARPREDCTTIVSFEEQMRGWLTVLAQARDIHQEVATYKRLYALLTFFGDITVLDFDATAAELFLQLRRTRVRIGSMDLEDCRYHARPWSDVAVSQSNGLSASPWPPRRRLDATRPLAFVTRGQTITTNSTYLLLRPLVDASTGFLGAEDIAAAGVRADELAWHFLLHDVNEHLSTAWGGQAGRL